MINAGWYKSIGAFGPVEILCAFEKQLLLVTEVQPDQYAQQDLVDISPNSVVRLSRRIAPETGHVLTAPNSRR